MLDSHLLKCFLYKTIKHKFNQRLHEIGAGNHFAAVQQRRLRYRAGGRPSTVLVSTDHFRLSI